MYVKVFHLIKRSLDLILGFKDALHFTAAQDSQPWYLVPTIDAATHSAENSLYLSQVPIFTPG